MEKLNNVKFDEKQIFEAVKIAYAAIEDKMGDEVIVLDISSVSILSDYFLIGSANNSNQLKAMAEFVQEKVESLGMVARHVEGAQSARWILIDFGYFTVHLFCKEEREYYRLEKIWGDARHVEHEELIS